MSELIILAVPTGYSRQSVVWCVAAKEVGTLEDFYYGNIVPCERQMANGSELKKAADRVARYESQLTEQLNETEQAILTKLIRSQHEIDSITAVENFILDIQKFYDKAKTKGRVKRYEGMKDLSLSAKTIRDLHAMLRQCLDQAVQERLIPYNPAAGYKLPSKEKKEMHTLPAEKISAYLTAAEEHGVLPMFYLELTTGIRRGELVALLWDDLDLENQTLTISKSAGRINGEVKVTQPKTANSVRTIYLPRETVDLLIREHTKHPGNPIMFPSPATGRLYGPDCIGRLHKTLLKKAGITENIPFHGLRHTSACAMKCRLGIFGGLASLCHPRPCRLQCCATVRPSGFQLRRMANPDAKIP